MSSRSYTGVGLLLLASLLLVPGAVLAQTPEEQEIADNELEALFREIDPTFQEPVVQTEPVTPSPNTSNTTVTNTSTPVPTPTPVTTTSTGGTDTASLIQQIAELLKIVEALQAQLAASQSGTPIKTQFTRNLNIGDEGEEVRALQGMLNSDPRTQIASSGDGSPGRETTYYGQLTANAVARFQELYAADILTPVGLTRGSGYFGPSTRAKLNALISQNINASQNGFVGSVNDNTTNGTSPAETLGPQTQNTTPTPSVAATQTTEGEISSDTLPTLSLTGGLTNSSETVFAVGEASAYAGAPGETITLNGTKLTNGTRIHFDNTSVTGTVNSLGTSLTFTIPDVTKGPYELTFTNDSGEEALRIMDFAVTVPNAVPPVITSISPAVGPNGSEITIFGTGFTPTNNQVEFGLNAVTGIPSPDGKTLVVNVQPDIGLPTAEQSADIPNAEWPVFIYVANENGRIEVPAVFIIKN